jgi:hypothetical protein
MKGKLQLLGIGAAMVLAVVVPGHAVAGKPNTLAIRSQSAIYQPSTGRVTFRVVFNRSPDFSTADELGRQADEFQYFVGSDAPVEPELYDSIVRGGEIHSTGLIRVRNNSLVPDPTMGSGGWGSVRGEVSFDLRGPVLLFSAPLSVVTDRTDLGVLPYMLETYEFGNWTGVHIVGYIVIRR